MNKAYPGNYIRIIPLIFIHEGTPDKKWAMVVAVMLILVLIAYVLSHDKMDKYVLSMIKRFSFSMTYR